MKVEWLCNPKMFSTNSGDYYLTNVISKDEKDTTLAASCVLDSKTGNVILKLVNSGTQPGKMKINLSDFKNVIPGDEQTVLTGDAEAENTFDNPQNVSTEKSLVKVETNFEYQSPAMSLTVIRIKTVE